MMMKRLLLIFAALLGAPAALRSQEVLPSPDPRLGGALERHCLDCHGEEEPEAGLDLGKLERGGGLERLERLARIRRRVGAGEMPPPGGSDLAAEERRDLLERLDDRILLLSEALGEGAGRVTIRRLSRAEYRNTVRDLFGVSCEAVEGFPADDLGYGFDNIGDALSVSLLHVENYAAAAEEVARRTISDENPDDPPRRRFEAGSMKSSIAAGGGEVANLYTNGQVEQVVDLPRSGLYRLRVRVWADQAGDEAARLRVRCDGEDLLHAEVPETRESPGVRELELRLEGGRRRFELAFTNDYWDPKNPDPKRRDRNLRIDWLEVSGPHDRLEPGPGERWILAADPGRGEASRRAAPVLKEMVRRIWRRPARSGEVERLRRLVAREVDEGASFRAGLRLALEAMLTSPHFLFRSEPVPRSRRDRDVAVSDHQLATRLAYFLWSSAPDVELLDLADEGRIADPEVLRAQTDRLLADPRAEALATNFAAQWLELRNLDEVQPDPERFGGFDRSLGRSMRRETELFVREVMRSDAPVTELVTARWSILDGALAAHYGIDGVEGAAFRRVELADPLRGGLLGHASVQTVTSNPTRTSPVKRGKWILENLLDAAPPAPPPGADSLGDEAVITDAATLREKMEAHRRDPSCAVCHLKMDALGFAMEAFDAVGRRRDGPVDTRGSLPDGRALAGVEDLKRVLASDPNLPAAVARKLFVYAVGREPSPRDEVLLRRGVAGAGGLGASLSDLVRVVVSLDAFSNSGPEGPTRENRSR